MLIDRRELTERNDSVCYSAASLPPHGYPYNRERGCAAEASTQESPKILRQFSMTKSFNPPALEEGRTLPPLRSILSNPPSPREALRAIATPQKQDPSLSIFELPTGTYMWPRFDPFAIDEGKEKPHMFVSYKGTLEERIDHTHPRDTLPPRRLLKAEAMERSEWDVPRVGRKRSSSVESQSPPTSPSDRALKIPRPCSVFPHNGNEETAVCKVKELRDERRPSVEQPCRMPDAPLVQSRRNDELRRSFCSLRLKLGQSEEEHPRTAQTTTGVLDDHDKGTPTRSPPTTLSSGYQLQPVRALAPVEIPGPVHPAAVDKWQEFSLPLKTLGQPSQYVCTWPTTDGHEHKSQCGYASKRHLVKRHIESKHLQLRPCICYVCGKGFSQKSNLETHLNTHTGQAPHRCHYSGCNEYFKDPARRHRHMKAVHQHVSSRSKKSKLDVHAGTTPDFSDYDDDDDTATVSSY